MAEFYSIIYKVVKYLLNLSLIRHYRRFITFKYKVEGNVFLPAFSFKSLNSLLYHAMQIKFLYIQKHLVTVKFSKLNQAACQLCKSVSFKTNCVQIPRHAEQAMALTKRRGGHRIEYFDPTQKQARLDALTLENHLRHAIRHQELRLFYQPKICSRTLQITGVEALIRWHHRELGLILPEHFVPIAERSGLIAEIGAWALNEGCRQARDWLDEGLPPLKMAVNVSAAQTQRGNLVDTVRQALHDSGLPPHQLILELTETLLIESGDQARCLITQLKQLGLSRPRPGPAGTRAPRCSRSYGPDKKYRALLP